MTAPIPQVIHRVWMGGPMPLEFEAFGADWERLNPGWKVRTWRERDITQFRMVNADLFERAPQLCPEKFIPRFRSNLVRYEILERHGGVYVDCDLRPLEALPDLDGVEVFAGWERQGEWVGNSILGSVPGHRFFGALIDGAAESCERFGPERSPVTTGPQYLTRTWKALGLDGDGVRIFDEPVFYPRSWRDLNAGRPPVDLPAEAVTDHLWAALRGSVSVIVPYRPDGAERDRNLAWVLDRLTAEHPDWQIIIQEEPEGEREGLFNRARLIREGVARSFGDIIVVHDGDVWCPGLPDAVARVQAGARWALPHATVHRLTPDATVAVLAGAPLDESLPADEPPYMGCVTGGAVAVARDTFHACPPDDRFRGWGGEDLSWGRALVALAGAAWGSPERLYHLWHQPQPRISRSKGTEENEALTRRYLAAAANPAAMAALVAEHAGGDPGPGIAPPSTDWWRHVRTGRVRRVTVGSPTSRRLAAHPGWEPCDAPTGPRTPR